MNRKKGTGREERRKVEEEKWRKEEGERNREEVIKQLRTYNTLFTII